MKQETLLAKISREYFIKKNVFSYRTKKTKDLSDIDVIRFCHWYCNENNQINEFEQYRTEVESQYYYCSYLREFIDEGVCYDIQMISNGYIKRTALPKNKLNIEKAKSSCFECIYKMD